MQTMYDTLLRQFLQEYINRNSETMRVAPGQAASALRRELWRMLDEPDGLDQAAAMLSTDGLIEAARQAKHQGDRIRFDALLQPLAFALTTLEFETLDVPTPAPEPAPEPRPTPTPARPYRGQRAPEPPSPVQEERRDYFSKYVWVYSTDDAAKRTKRPLLKATRSELKRTRDRLGAKILNDQQEWSGLNHAVDLLDQHHAVTVEELPDGVREQFVENF